MAICFLDPSTVERVRSHINDDPEFKLAAKFLSKDILLGVGDSACIVNVRDGAVTSILLNPTVMDPWHFCIKGSAEAWEKFLQPLPPPFCNALYPAIIRQIFQVAGDLEGAFAHFWAVARMLDVMREVQNCKRG